MARQASELATSSSAKARYTWISPTKVREVATLIKGKPIDEARRILAFTPKAASRFLSKVLESAVANAEHNHQIPQDELTVTEAWADEGPAFKRMQPRARGARNIIRKRTSHIYVVLSRQVAAAVARTPAPAPTPIVETEEPKPRRARRSARKKPDEKATSEGKTKTARAKSKAEGAGPQRKPKKPSGRKSRTGGAK